MANRLWDLIRAADPGPREPFVETLDGRIVAYGDMAMQTARMARALVEMGVEPGHRVAVQVEKSVEALLLYLACVRAGAVFLPLNTAYTKTEIAYFLGDATPRLFVCDPGRRGEFDAAAREAGVELVETLDAAGEGSLVERFAQTHGDFEDRPRRPADLAAILYTSGTTGRSKGAMLTHENLASNALALVDAWRFTRNDALIHALPIYHTHGLFVATNTVLLSGGRMIFLPGFDADAIMQAMPRATALMGVPTFYTRLLRRADLTPERVRGMRLFVSGSAPLLAETHRAWFERTGHAILERYGMTETNMNTSNPYDGDRIAGTVGFPLPGVELRIADPETGARALEGDIGIIEVKGPNVFVGYWNMPEKTAAEFRSDGFFVTGDLGLVDPNGYVHIVGREKDLVITGGFNVYPKEVEDEIDALDGVLESAVIGAPHPDFGEGVVAIVVTTPGSGLDATGIRDALMTRLAKFKQPKAVIFVDELPRNAMGKVQKSALRETWRHLFAKA
jgi:malonyl-CoA/methylmalonyl-CoA synthetase